jgi:uncharacterized membrane protein
MKALLRFEKYFPYVICFLFFVLYSILSIVKHNHFLSGYDLTISDQAIWLMSQFKNPISTPHAYPFTSLFSDHVEIIYAVLSPIYWFNNDPRVLLLIQTLLISFSAIPIFMLAKKKKLNTFVCYALLISFLLFYGIQNAVWADVHSLVFAAAFLPWFIYFLYEGRTKLTWLFFVLMIICKEDIALMTLLISGIFFIMTKKKIAIALMSASVLYIFLLFFIYYPYFTPDGYRFQNENGLLSNINAANMYNTPDKRDVILYSLAWYGFLPLLAPLHLIPFVGDLAHYFVLGNNQVTSAQGMFLHYRVTLAALLVLPTILVIQRFKRLNTIYTAAYLLICALLLQYILHLPLSYLAKSWFWAEPSGVKHIQAVLPSLPEDASVVSHVNINAHISHREEVFVLWPEKKTFAKNSPCGQQICEWFRWPGKPEYLIADISPEWDARHLLTNNSEFKQGIANLEKAQIIKVEKRIGSATLYKVVKDPQTLENYK